MINLRMLPPSVRDRCGNGAVLKTGLSEASLKRRCAESAEGAALKAPERIQPEHIFRTLSFFMGPPRGRNVLCFPGFSCFRDSVPLGIKAPVFVIYSSLKPSFSNCNLCFRSCAAMKRSASPLSHLSDQGAPFPFCNLRPFLTFVPSIGSTFV